MSHDQDTHPSPRPARTMRLSNQDFANWGVNKAAYVRPTQAENINGIDETGIVYTVHAANGQELGILESHDHAVAAIIQQGMQPFSVH